MPLKHVSRNLADQMYRDLCEELRVGIKRLQNDGYDVHIEFENDFHRDAGEIGRLAVTYGAGTAGLHLHGVAYCLSRSSGRAPTLSLTVRSVEGDDYLHFYYPVAHPLRPVKPAWAKSQDGGTTLDGLPYSGVGAVADSEELARHWINNITEMLIELYSA